VGSSPRQVREHEYVGARTAGRTRTASVQKLSSQEAHGVRFQQSSKYLFSPGAFAANSHTKVPKNKYLYHFRRHASSTANCRPEVVSDMLPGFTVWSAHRCYLENQCIIIFLAFIKTLPVSSNARAFHVIPLSSRLFMRASNVISSPEAHFLKNIISPIL
jgi:hypothetical protein